MSEGGKGPGRILVVEDSKTQATGLRMMLEAEGFGVDVAYDGEQALIRIMEDDFAVILMDVVMPGLGGYETAELIRQREENVRTPIVFLSGIDISDEHIQKGYAMGAVDYMTKPVVPEILKSKVAVFVDLYEKNQALLEDEQTRWRQALRSTLEQYQGLSSAGKSSPITEAIGGTGPIRDRLPKAFHELWHSYSDLLREYLDHLLTKTPTPDSTVSSLAGRIGDLGGGPRDVVDIHLQTLQELFKDSNPVSADAVSREGRLLALEVMGQLVEYYRIGIRRSSNPEETK